MAADRTPPTDGDELVHPAVVDAPEGDVTRVELVPARSDSPLRLSIVTLAPDAVITLGDDERGHELVYVLEGEIALGCELGSQTLRADSAFLHPGEDGVATVSARGGAARLAVFGAGPECDEHAALGARSPFTMLDLREADSATGKRSFQVMLGPENGCCRATMFVGVVPPGAAPWHFHQYDEIVLILAGAGVYHQAGGDQPTAPGSAVRIPPRTVHINENTTDDDMLVLGVFTPAGSPAAAYLAPDPRRQGAPR